MIFNEKKNDNKDNNDNNKVERLKVPIVSGF